MKRMITALLLVALLSPLPMASAATKVGSTFAFLSSEVVKYSSAAAASAAASTEKAVEKASDKATEKHGKATHKAHKAASAAASAASAASMK